MSRSKSIPTLTKEYEKLKLSHKINKIQMQNRMMSSFGGGFYSGASRSGNDMKNWFPRDAEDDVTALSDHGTLRARSNDLVKNNPIATGAVKTVKTNVLGTGLQLQARPDRRILKLGDEADEIEDQIEAEWELFSNSTNVDFYRRHNLNELATLALHGTLKDGNSYGTLPYVDTPYCAYSLKVCLIPDHRVCNPDDRQDTDQVAGGIECDEYGRLKGYHVASKQKIDFSYSKRKWAYVPAFGETTGRTNMFHIFESNGIGQRKGLPFLTSVIQPLKNIDRYSQSALVKAIIDNMFTVFIKYNEDTEDEDDKLSEEEFQRKYNYELGNGLINYLQKGESMEVAQSTSPSAQYESFISSQLRQIGMATEIPFEILNRHFTASYSASRGSQLEAWKFFKRYRVWFVSRFYTPIYKEFFCEAVLRGRLKAPGFFDDPLIQNAWLGAYWRGPAMPQLDILKEAKAYEIIEKNNWMSGSDIASTVYETDYDDVLARKKRELTKRTVAGLELQPSLFDKQTKDPKQSEPPLEESKTDEEDEDDE